MMREHEVSTELADAVSHGVGDLRVRGEKPAPRGSSEATQRSLPDEFAKWYEDHRGSVYRYVRFRVASRETAEDITSDVFLKALRSQSRYDPSLASPCTWLLRIARNTLLDHFRGLRRRGSLHVSLDRAHDLAAEGPSQEERMLREERIQALLNASHTLRAGDQEILSLRYGAGLMNPEIAESLGISANAVAVRLHRALQRLKDAVDEQAGEVGGGADRVGDDTMEDVGR
jgi:RNA polymerase sigma-70 factor (ECF subfamily)